MADKNCGNCGNRLHYHYKYNDINKNSRYSRCAFRPELKQKNNSYPKWCPLRVIKGERIKEFEEKVNDLVKLHNITDVHAGCYLCNYDDKFICHEFNNGCESINKCRSIHEKDAVINSK